MHQQELPPSAVELERLQKEKDAKNNLFPLGMTLLVAASIYILLILTNIAYYLPLALAGKEESVFAWQMLLYVVLIVLYNILLIAGALAILWRRAYQFAFVSCCLAIVPILGPCWVFGIPIGIWGIIALSRDGVRESFS